MACFPLDYTVLACGITPAPNKCNHFGYLNLRELVELTKMVKRALLMRVISIRTLRNFWEQPNREDSAQPLKAWYDEAKVAKWDTPQAVKEAYGTASIVANNRVVFNIAGNKYRLVVGMDYPRQMCFVKFIGTHAEYDKIDVAKV